MSKVLFISGALNFGAPGRIVEQLGLLAVKHGYEVLVAHSSRNMNPSKLSHYIVTTKCQEFRHAIGAKFLDLHGLLSTRQTEMLIDRIKEFNPDIIHLHNLHGYYCNFKVLFEYLGDVDIPVIWTLHDCWAFTGRCFHFEGANCYKWKTCCYDCKADPGYTVSRYFDRSRRMFSLKKNLLAKVNNLTIVPVSKWLAEYVNDSILSGRKTQIIHNGVDITLFKPRHSNLLRQKHKLDNKFVILGVAAPWNNRKGLADFIKLSRELDDSYAIILIGLTSKQIKKMPENVIGLERTESVIELAEYYTLANVFCNLTYLDNFPTVNLEALACGTPVITYRTGGSPEAIDEKTGFVVEQGSIKDVVSYIKMLKEETMFLAEDCRQRALEHYNKDNCFMMYIDLYNSLLAKQ